MSRHEWTEAEKTILRELYPDTKTKKLAHLLGLSIKKISSKANAIGVKKSATFFAGPDAYRLTGETGAETRFTPGQIPWNKGKKGLNLGGKETQFKKGQKPHTWHPIGTERITHDGYLERKISDTGITRHDYVQVHRLAWIEHNGKIPDGQIIVFKDGNKTNITIDNLECISRSELMRRNTFHNYPKEIAELVQLRGAITRQINKRERKSS